MRKHPTSREIRWWEDVATKNWPQFRKSLDNHSREATTAWFATIGRALDGEAIAWQRLTSRDVAQLEGELVSIRMRPPEEVNARR
jgi:hypothetical protein